ncbi:MAG: C25 family cysteine peptidase [Thermoplasmatota archaeon]
MASSRLKERVTRPAVLRIGAVSIIALLLVSVLALFLLSGKEDAGGPVYDPSVELPADYMFIVDDPRTDEDLLSIAALTSVQFMGGEYHPLVVCDQEGGLSRQILYTLAHLETQRQMYLFTNKDSSLTLINTQLSDIGYPAIPEERVFELTPDSSANFIGFQGVMTVSSYEEALWSVVYAKEKNLGIIKGEPTFLSQEEAWAGLRSMDITSDYIIVANPLDRSTGAIHSTPDYDTYDDAFFTPSMSLMAAQMSAYHDAYVITNTTPVSSVEWELDMELSPNRRAVGVLNEIRSLSGEFGQPDYIALTGSAAAIPQFLVRSGGTEGDIVNSDVIYGFIDGDDTLMDAAVGRIVQYDVSLASNQLLKTYLLDDFSETVTAEYRDVAGGTHEVRWRTHGASFSGYEITYERMQATPGRWICTDFEDAGFTYDYVGPFNTGNKFFDGVINSMENDLSEICEASGYVAYRGHGSDTGSLYGIRVYGPNGDEHVLRYSDCKEMDVPPQIAFFVSCLNGKIYGHGPGTDPSSDVAFENLFTLNYLSAGPAVLVGATEVSFSNIGQDLKSLPAEYLPFVDDHQWDHNDAWYAFVWDGILNHPDEHGTIGNAVRWSENRYMNYPPNNQPSPMDPNGEVDWYEVTFFAVYGDPSFRPAIDPSGGPGDFDPWHNGPDDM